MTTVFSQVQERIKTSEIYISKEIAYKESNNTIFTGIAEYRKNNGHLVFEKEYTNGYITKYTLYYNTDEKIVSDETLYYENNIKKRHIIFASSSDYPLKTITDFDLNGKKTLEEQYLGDKLIYHCEYFNGKKHGTIYSIDKNNVKHSCTYNNGKKIKYTAS